MKQKKQIIKLLVLLALLVGSCIGAWGIQGFRADFFHAAWDFSTTALLNLLILVLGVLSAANLILLTRSVSPKTHRGRTLVSLIASLVKYAAALVILCCGLSILGVDVSTIAASVGILALIVGFGAESLIADVITGIFMLFENQCNVGDIIEVGGFRGTIQEIGIRTTSVVDAGGNIRIVNNADMKNILNRSDKASISVCDIGIPYETDLEALEAKFPAMLEEIYTANGETMKKCPEYLGVQSLDASAITLRFIVEVKEKSVFSTQRVLNRALLLGLRKLGVECPYQQIDIHTR